MMVHGPGERTLAEIEQLYRRRYRAFVRVAEGMLGDRERARDAVQEAFARAIRSRRDYRAEGSLEAWIWRMLTNHCRDLLRTGSAAEPIPATLVANGRPPVDPDVRAAVAALPERQRLVLFLRHYADLGYDDIGEIAGIERGTVAATLHAARAALRTTITEVVE
jgi:DNA-directed RNA polymerase specialized sigma24 family protein